MEVRAAGGQHHLVCLDLLAGHMQHDVAEQATLAHAVHGDEGVVVVALGVVRDAVAIAVEQLHAALHHGAALRGLPGPLPHSRQLEVTEGRDEMRKKREKREDRRNEIFLKKAQRFSAGELQVMDKLRHLQQTDTGCQKNKTEESTHTRLDLVREYAH